MTAQSPISLEWVACFYDEEQAVVRRYVTDIQERAAERIEIVLSQAAIVVDEFPREDC